MAYDKVKVIEGYLQALETDVNAVILQFGLEGTDAAAELRRAVTCWSDSIRLPLGTKKLVHVGTVGRFRQYACVDV
jgi:hypothetical protein